MTIESSIKDWVEQSIDSTDLFIIGIDISGSKIKIELDSINGVGINECVKVSRFVEENLELEGADFSIEVTSSGIGQPFKVFQQYKKHIGKEVEITETNGLKKTGLLLEADSKRITIEVKPAKKKSKNKNKETLTPSSIEIPMESIKESKATISFK